MPTGTNEKEQFNSFLDDLSDAVKPLSAKGTAGRILYLDIGLQVNKVKRSDSPPVHYFGGFGEFQDEGNESKRNSVNLEVPKSPKTPKTPKTGIYEEILKHHLEVLQKMLGKAQNIIPVDAAITKELQNRINKLGSEQPSANTNLLEVPGGQGYGSFHLKPKEEDKSTNGKGEFEEHSLVY